jgi:hypothetical protein
MPEGTTAPASGSDGTGSAPVPDGTPAGSDQQPAAGSAAPDAATGQQSEEVTLTAAEAKKLRDENAALRRKSREADKASEEARKAQLSEAERLAEERAEFDREKAALAAERKSLRVRTATATTANRIGAIYPDVIEAMVLSQMEAVEFDDAGAPTNIEAVITDIRRSHPHLFRAGTGSADGGPQGRQAPRGNSVNDAIRSAAGRR